MAIGWMTVLKMVPWGDVIENVPKVAAGAKKLWTSVGKKSPPDTASANGHVPDGPQALTDAQRVAALQSQVLELQVASAALHQQMLESSALIQSLAEQNTQLVQRVEINRKRLLGLAVVCAALAVIALWPYFQ